MKKQFKLGSPSGRKSPRKLIVLSILALIFILAALAAYWFVLRDNNTDLVDKNANDPTITSAKDTAPVDNEDKQGGSSTTSDQVPVSEDLAVGAIDYKQQDGKITASAQLDGATQEGTCVFSFTATESRPVVKESRGQTSCSISASEIEFDKIGEWNLEVTFYHQNTKTSSSKKVMVN